MIFNSCFKEHERHGKWERGESQMPKKNASKKQTRKVKSAASKKAAQPAKPSNPPAVDPHAEQVAEEIHERTGANTGVLNGEPVVNVPELTATQIAVQECKSAGLTLFKLQNTVDEDTLYMAAYDVDDARAEMVRGYGNIPQHMVRVTEIQELPEDAELANIDLDAKLIDAKDRQHQQAAMVNRQQQAKVPDKAPAVPSDPAPVTPSPTEGELPQLPAEDTVADEAPKQDVGDVMAQATAAPVPDEKREYPYDNMSEGDKENYDKDRGFGHGQ